jgi:hypothetical protein
MSSVNIEYELEKRFVLALRAIFEIDDTFVYNDDEETTKLLIASEYPQQGTEIKIPRIIVTNISFGFNSLNSINNNFYREVFVNGKYGQEFLNIIPYNVNLMCLAPLFDSKDLANKVLNYISFEASEVFDAVQLNVMNVAKGVTVPQSQYPEKIFETPIAVQGKVDWKGVKIPNTDYEKQIAKITDQLTVK